MILSLLQSSPGLAIAFIVSLVIAISIHEFSHALAAYSMGDATAKDLGRLTLNPLAHLDPMGSVMLLVAGFGWGKPTPYNPYNLRYKKYGPLLVSLAGPVSNCIAAAVSFGLLLALEPFYSPDNMLVIFLTSLFFVNSMLMIFNLIPIPPLDGAQFLFTLLPSRFDNFKVFLAKNGPMVLFMLILLDSFSSISIFGTVYRFFFGFLSRFIS